MKNIMNMIILSPILIYVIILLINTDLLSNKQEVNIFWIFRPELPVISLVSVFFIVYIIFLYFSEKFSLFFAGNKNKKLENQVLELKAKLADQIPDIVSDIKAENKRSLDLSKKETDKVLGNLEFEIKNLKEKIEKSS